MKTMISCENIKKAYGEGNEKRYVLDDVSVKICEGEFVSVMGPSGSGKSTLMFALCGMDRVDGGKVYFNGKDLSGLQENDLSDLRRTEMGFIFQQPTLLRNLNILDNIVLPSMIGKRSKSENLQLKAKKLMEQTGIPELENRDITQASGGQLQRVGICRALMGNPKIIFGDEPTGALNSKSANEIMDLLAEIHRSGTTILLITHDARIAAKSERVLFMLDGKIIGEFRNGIFDGNQQDLVTREEKLNLWLSEMKF